MPEQRLNASGEAGGTVVRTPANSDDATTDVSIGTDSGGFLNDLLDVLNPFNGPDVPYSPGRPGPSTLGGTADALTHADDLAKKDRKMKVSELWVAKGGPRSEAKTAAAVAKAESSCNNKAHNECCVCLMQVNTIAHKQYDRQRLMDDPEYCMEAAVQIWHAQGWGAWQVYTEGTYEKYLGDDCEITLDKNSLIGDAVDAVSAPFEALANLVATLFQAKTWFRVGKVLLGGALLLIVTYQLLRGN